MTPSILEEKRILAVDDEPGVLEILEEEILVAAPNCHFDKATEYQRAHELLSSLTYDLVIIDIMGIRGLNLLDLAVNRPFPFPVAMLTAYVLNPEFLRHFTEMGVRAYLPKEKLGEVVPLLEDVLRHEDLPFWRRIVQPLRGVLNTRARKTLVEVQG